MGLTPMRYKDYIWPHNPETYSVTYQRKIAVRKIPFGRYCMQELGPSYRVMQGEGTFAGHDAYQEFRRLAETFEQDGSGLLIHPVWQAASAYFVSLELTEEPLPDLVRYCFSFWEDCGRVEGLTTVGGGGTGNTPGGGKPSGGAAAAEWYTVKKGDTLWGIAKQHGVTLQSLIAANPQIKNPNLIYSGNRVRIR